MGILGPPSKAETVMEGERSGSKSGHQQLVAGRGSDGKENKGKPRCITSCRGVQPSRFVARKPPREPETACLSLVFPGEH